MLTANEPIPPWTRFPAPLEGAPGHLAGWVPTLHAEGGETGNPTNMQHANSVAGDSCSLTVGLVNEGKLTHGKVIELQEWFSRMNLDVLLVSEGALLERSTVMKEGLTYMGPVGQRWGGAGIMCRSELAEGRPVKLLAEEKKWSISIWAIDSVMAIVGGYITPHASADREVMARFLMNLERATIAYPHVIIGGDFNAATGSGARDIVNQWAEENHLSLLVNQGTHRVSTEAPITDIDLLFVRGTQRCELELLELPSIGHARMTAKAVVHAITIIPKRKKIAWNRLADRLDTFQSQVEQSLWMGTELNSAMQTAGIKVLGFSSTDRVNRIPRSVRTQVRQARSRLRHLPRGTVEYRDCLTQISDLFRKWKHRGWRAKLNSLAQSELNRDAWTIAKRLACPARPVGAGIPTHELTQTVTETFSTNTLMRPEWLLREISVESTQALDIPFSLEELHRVLSKLPKHKAPGPDGIPYHVYSRCIDNQAICWHLLDKFNHYLQFGYSASVEPARIIALPKATGGTRMLTLLNSERKILEKLIMERIRYIDLGIHSAQSGFRPGRGTMHCLLTLQLAILEAHRLGDLLAVRSYDVHKAFDRVPKPLLSKAMYASIAPHGLKLAHLAAQLVGTPVEAEVGTAHAFLHTGAPQGGILSPLSYILVDNVICDILGDRLVKYADDNTTMCHTEREQEWAEHVINTHYAYWGGQLNPSKTQSLTVNAEASPASIRVLGANVGATGISPRVAPTMFLGDTHWLSRLGAKGGGLTCAQLLVMAQQKSWTKAAYALPLSLPPLRTLTYAWFRLVRVCLHTYPTANTVRVLEAVGVLKTPMWWGIKQTISFYFTCQRDTYLLHAVHKYAAGFETLRVRVDEFLRPCGLTFEDISRATDLKMLIHRARIAFIAWITQEIISESERIGSTRPPIIRLYTAKYLQMNLGRYGFPFLQEHLGPHERQPATCFFCGIPGMDTGTHLINDCMALAHRPLLPQRVWSLADNCSKQELTEVLSWMQETWRQRKKLFVERGRPLAPLNPRRSASKFLTMPSNRPPASQRLPRERDNGHEEELPTARRQRRVAPLTAARPRRGRAREDLTDTLDGPPIRRRRRETPTLGIAFSRVDDHNGNLITTRQQEGGGAIGEASRRRGRPSEDLTQILEGPQTSRRRLMATPAPTYMAHLRKGRWTAEEDELLLQALTEGRDIRNAVPTRDERQVDCRLKTIEFRTKMNSRSLAAPIPTAQRLPPRRKWNAADCAALLEAVNAVGNAVDLRAIHARCNTRSLAAITRKINQFFQEGRITFSEGVFALRS